MCHLSMKHLCQKLLKFNKARSSQLKCRGCFLRRKRLTDLKFIFLHHPVTLSVHSSQASDAKL